jgi:hypothetical protein
MQLGLGTSMIWLALFGLVCATLRAQGRGGRDRDRSSSRDRRRDRSDSRDRDRRRRDRSDSRRVLPVLAPSTTCSLCNSLSNSKLRSAAGGLERNWGSVEGT